MPDILVTEFIQDGDIPIHQLEKSYLGTCKHLQ